MAATCIMVFKKEKCDPFDSNNQTNNVMHTYKMLWKIIKLRTIKDFAVVMLAYEVIIHNNNNNNYVLFNVFLIHVK